jgi:hypothetical protein
MAEETPESVRRCANCGAELRPNDRYCGECGLPTFVSTSPAKTPSPSSSPQEPAPAPSQPARPGGGGAWAIIVGVLLILIGLGGCALGSLVLLVAPVAGTGSESGFVEAASGLCCVLPALALAAAGGFIWYRWGRSRA